MSDKDEIRALAERVKNLRQELELVEARLREHSGDEPLAPIEPMDSPTVLTTNHAQKRARSERLAPALAVLATVGVLGGGIAVGYAIRPDPPQPVVQAPVVVTVTASAPTPSVPPPPAVSVAPPAPVAVAIAPPSVTAAPPPPPPPPQPVVPVSTAPLKKYDRGF